MPRNRTFIIYKKVVFVLKRITFHMNPVAIRGPPHCGIYKVTLSTQIKQGCLKESNCSPN